MAQETLGNAHVPDENTPEFGTAVPILGTAVPILSAVGSGTKTWTDTPKSWLIRQTSTDVPKSWLIRQTLERIINPGRYAKRKKLIRQKSFLLVSREILDGHRRRPGLVCTGVTPRATLPLVTDVGMVRVDISVLVPETRLPAGVQLDNDLRDALQAHELARLCVSDATR